MNRFGFLAENIKPLKNAGPSLGFGKNFKDCLMSRDEKKSLFANFGKTTKSSSFGSKKSSGIEKLSTAQKAHRKNFNKVAKMVAQGVDRKEAWELVKSGAKKLGSKRPTKKTSDKKKKPVKKSGIKKTSDKKKKSPVKKAGVKKSGVKPVKKSSKKKPTKKTSK